MTLARQLVTSIVLLISITAGAGVALGQTAPPAPDPVAEAGCTRFADYATARFGSSSNRVRHALLPLEPGTRRVFEARSNATGAVLPHRLTVTVTGLTKVVDTHRGVVVWSVDEVAGQVTESKLAVFARDRADNVWNLGEYAEEYPEGVFAGAPGAWFAGVAEAEPGIRMPAAPAVGLPEFLRGWAPGPEVLDCATIADAAASVCVPAGCFQNVLVVHERSPLDPAGGIQVESHAPGVGVVQIGALDDPAGETLVLTQRSVLAAADLQAANREAHVLDQRGRLCSDVYKLTLPLEGPDGGAFGPFTCAVPPPPEEPEPPPATGGPTIPAPFSTALPAIAPAQPVPPPAGAVAPAGASRPPATYRARVDHPLFPLHTVRTMLYKGREGGERIRVESRVRSRRVPVAGAMATAVDVTERENGKLVERATDYYAQDRAGNVWSLGERVDNIEDGRVVDHDGEWIAGREGARRGLLIPAAPKVGQSFRPSRAPGVSQDRSTVVAVDAAVTTPAGRFTGCLETRDKDLRSSEPAERKFYCPGVGLVRERPSDGKVDLVRFR